MPEKLSFKDFLEKYKSKETFAIGHTAGTLGYSILTYDEKTDETHEYIHPDIDEADLGEWTEFLEELEKAFHERRPS